MSKRLSPVDSNGSDSRGGRESPTTAKRPKYVIFEPVRLPAISTVSDLDHKVLVVQNQKLSQRLAQRRRVEDELRRRIEQLEKRQTQDDALLCIINRHWNRLDEDVRILLERFDADIADEPELKSEGETTSSFIAQLSQWDKEELSERLLQRVEFSKRAIAKLVAGFDRLVQRNERIAGMLKKNNTAAVAPKSASSEAKLESAAPKDEITEDGGGGGATPTTTVVNETKEETTHMEVDDENETTTTTTTATVAVVVVKQEPKDEAEKTAPPSAGGGVVVNVDKAVAEMNIQLVDENSRLQKLMSKLQEKNHVLTVRYSRMEDRLTAAETSTEELKSKLEEAEYNFQNSRNREDKLEYHLAEVKKQLQSTELQVAAAVSSSSGGGGGQNAPAAAASSGTTTSKNGGGSGELANVSKRKLEELQAQLDEQKELASTRLQELHDLTDQYKEARRAVEALKMELSQIPEDLVVKSSEYRRLQSHFSVLYTDNVAIRSQLDECRQEVDAAKAAHMKQIAQMESEELMAQKQLRAEMVQLEDQLSQVRREYEMLRVEFEQNLAANEQSGPLNKEMRQLLAGFKMQYQSSKAEATRFKRKWREAVSLIAKAQKELDQERKAKENSIVIPLSPIAGKEEAAGSKEGGGGDSTTAANEPTSGDEHVDEPIGDLSESEEDEQQGGDHDDDKQAKAKMAKEKIKQLTRKCSELQAELEAYKNLSAEEHVKAQNEKKLILECQKLRAYVRHCARKRGKDAMTVPEEPNKHIKKLEEQIERLKKEVQACKQEEEALLNEMESTGQAFEEMQEQNVRLVQQLKEKDDANFKMMSERIRSNQQHKLLREEKELLDEQVAALHNQVEAQNLVVRKLEEKERLLVHQLGLNEKEIASRQQASELHKKKATEMSQSVFDLKLQLDKMSSQLAEAQTAVATKTAALEEESFKMRRLQEEISGLRKRLERLKKMEQASTADEVLLEEIRELKSQLICPSCKVQRKDAVLTKCFHVFCMDCLKTRYETRQRKCPKCNAAFGANDFKRIYIG